MIVALRAPSLANKFGEVDTVPVSENRVVAKGDGREVGFQDGGCFSRFSKQERINN